MRVVIPGSGQQGWFGITAGVMRENEDCRQLRRVINGICSAHGWRTLCQVIQRGLIGAECLNVEIPAKKILELFAILLPIVTKDDGRCPVDGHEASCSVWEGGVGDGEQRRHT